MTERVESVELDSFAWLEYLFGSRLGAQVRPWVEKTRSLTPSVVLAELSEKHQRFELDFGQALKLIGVKTRIVPLDKTIGVLAGRLAFERKKRVKGWGVIDSIILASARNFRLKILTGDSRSKDLRNEVIMIN